MTGGRSRDYARRAKGHLLGHMQGPIIKCATCKTTWLFGRNRRIGLCSKCAIVALNRNDWQILAKSCEGVVGARWLKDEWPGILSVKFQVEDDSYATRSITYHELEDWPGGVVDWALCEWGLIQGERHNAETQLD